MSDTKWNVPYRLHWTVVATFCMLRRTRSHILIFETALKTYGRRLVILHMVYNTSYLHIFRDWTFVLQHCIFNIELIWMANLFLGTTSRILHHMFFFSSNSDCPVRFIAFTTPCTSYSIQRLYKIDKIRRRKRSVSSVRGNWAQTARGMEVRAWGLGWFVWLW